MPFLKKSSLSKNSTHEEIPDNSDPKSNTLVVCQSNVSSFPLLFSQLWFHQTFCICVQSSLWLAFLWHFYTLNPSIIFKRAFKFKMADGLPLWKSLRLLWESLSSCPYFTLVLNFWIFLWANVLLFLWRQKGVNLGDFTYRWGQRRKKKNRWLEGEKWWLREDGWLQESEATGGQDVPLLVEACWKTGHDAASVCVRVCVCDTVSLY